MIAAATIYVHETDESWDFYTSDANHTIKCVVAKPASVEEQLLWKEKLRGSAESNIISVMDVEDSTKVPEKEQSTVTPQEDYDDPNEPQGSTMGDQEADDL